MELTPVQARTMERLIGTGERPTFPPDLSVRLRDRIEEAVRVLELSEPLWLGKEKLNEFARCEGFLQAVLSGERLPFRYSLKTATGKLLHKAIEIEVAGREDRGAHELSELAAERLRDDGAFAEFWEELDPVGRDQLLMEAAKALELFRGTFPPLRELRRELSPSTEWQVRVELLGGALVLSGTLDLVLGSPARVSEPARATRLAIDLKTGRAYPEHAEDMRFYALLLTLRFGVPPYRAATFFLESGEWQAEDVTEQTLGRAADRVIATARAAAALSNGRTPELRPGRYCEWCPRGLSCSRSSVRSA